jgi:hypothetical protein
MTSSSIHLGSPGVRLATDEVEGVHTLKMTPDAQSQSVLIASGSSLSASVDFGSSKSLVGVGMSAAWTTAGLTFQVSVDGGVTWLEFYDGGGDELLLTVSASQYVRVDPSTFLGVSKMKVRSGTSSVPVNQVADRTLTLILL